MKSLLIEILKYYRASKHKMKMLRHHGWGIAAHLRPSIRIKKEWHGSLYGGFYVHPAVIQSNATVISIGIGKDISFDRSLLKNHAVQVYAYDPTPKSIEWLQLLTDLPKNFTYFDFGISAQQDGKMIFYLPKDKRAVSASLELSEVMDQDDTVEVEMKTFESLLKTIPGKHISILKMDIEGAEYEVIESLFNDPEVQIDQLLIEFHDRMFDMPVARSLQSVVFLKERGYEIFGCSISSEEVSFIHRSVLQN
jgi:FkbM family methyltransferase